MKLSSRDLLSRLGLPTLVSSSAHSQIVITCSSWYMLYSAIPVFYSASSCPVSFLLRPCFGCLLSALVIEQLLDELLGQTSPSCQPLCHCALPGLPEYTTCKTVSFLPPPESKLTTSTCLLFIVFNKFTFNLLPVWDPLLCLLRHSCT